MSQIISKDRVKQFGEVFTPQTLVREMLSKIPQEIWIDTDKSFIDNSCGRGAFLIEVAKNKLQHTDETKKKISESRKRTRRDLKVKKTLIELTFDQIKNSK